MLKKEITDTLKQTALVLSFILLMPVVYTINTMRFGGEQLCFTWYIDWGMSFLIPVLILYLSYMIFSGEDSSGAAEYLKSLPVSNWKLLAVKVIPRFVVVLGLVVIYETLFMENIAHIGRFAWLYLPYNRLSILHAFLVILIPLVSGFVLGISNRKSPILYLALVIPALYLALSHYQVYSFSSNYFYRIWWRYFSNTGIFLPFFLDSLLTVYFPAVLPLLVLIPVFKSWDTSSGKIRSQRILKRMAAPLLLITFLYTANNFHLL